MASTKASGSKGARSSGPSPSPTSLTGTPSSRWTATTMPPLAVPSSLVSTMPVIPTTCENTSACRIPFCPVVPSRTSSTSSTGLCFSMTRFTLPSSSIRPTLFCSRPAVSMSTTSASISAAALTASKATAAGSAPSRSERMVGTPTRSPQVCSWSAAAARKVSAAPSTTSLSSATSTRASLPTVVVLPVPFTPTTSTQAGRPSTRDDTIERSIDGSTRASSSSRSQPRTVASSVLPSTATLVRRASTRSVVAATPRSAASRVSSTSSHAASSSVPPDSRASSPLPRAVFDRASRARSRRRRPAGASGRSTVGVGAGAGGSSGSTSVGAPRSMVPMDPSGGASTSTAGAPGPPASGVGGRSLVRPLRPRIRPRAIPPTTTMMPMATARYSHRVSMALTRSSSQPRDTRPNRRPRHPGSWAARSEDAHPVVGRQPHAVALADAERLVELAEVAGGVGAQVHRAVRVEGQQPLGLLPAGDAAPDLRPAQEEALLPRVAVDLGGRLVAERDAVGGVADGEPAEVADVLADGQGAVNLVAGRVTRLELVELRDEGVGARLEGGPVLVGPPVAQRARAVELRALVVEAVADLVSDDRPDAAVVGRVVGLDVEEGGLEDGGREDDLVQARVVVGVDRLRGHEPLVAVDGAAE